MSNVIKSYTVCETSGNAGSLSVRVDIRTLAIDYEAMTRDYEVSIVATSSADSAQSILGDSGNFTVFGVYVPFYLNGTLSSGENVLHTVTVSGVKNSDYAEKTVFYLRLNFICEALGLTSTVYISRSVGLWRLFTTPELGVRKMDFRLGEEIELVGEFLDAGYDVYAELTVNGNPTGSYMLTADKRTLPTFPELISVDPFSDCVPAEIDVWAYFDGVLLPEPLKLSVNLYLDEDDGAPETEVSISFSSDNEAVNELEVAVKDRSKVKIEPINATAKYGAMLERSIVFLDGVEYNEHCLVEMHLAGMHRYTVTVYDTRGFSSSISGEFEVLDYGPPTLNADAVRTDELGNASKKGEYISLLASASGVYPFDGSNEYSFFYTVSVQGREGEKEEIPFSPDTRATVYAGLDKGSSYELEIICRDSFGSTVVRKFLLECERIELNIAKNKVAVGKYASEEKLFDVAWPIRCVGDVRVVDEYGNENSLLGSSSQITLHNVSELSDFIDLVSPSEGEIALRLMNITDESIGYSKGLHVFLVYNFLGSGGHIELGQV